MLTTSLLRRALVLDAVASGGLGALLALFSGPLSGLFGLPPGLLRWASLVLIPFALALAVLARRSSPPRSASWAVVGVNAFWVADSVALLLAGWTSPTALGVAFVLAQAAAVASLAALQVGALRRVDSTSLSPAQ